MRSRAGRSRSSTGKKTALMGRLEHLLRLVVVASLSVLPPGGEAMGQTEHSRAPDASITFVEPDGTDDIVGEGEDFATIELGDPWDLDAATDIRSSRNLSDERFENGVYYATTSDNSSYFFLLWPGYPNAQNIGKTGQTHPIDSARYHWVSIALCSSEFGSLYFYWYYGVIGAAEAVVSGPIPVRSGCRVYTEDLADHAIGHEKWTGSINGFRVDPKVDGGDIEVHWARLTADPTTDQQIALSWEGLSPAGPGVELSLWLDQDGDGSDGWLIDTISDPPQSGSYQWGVSPFSSPANFEPGEYRICAEVDGAPAGCSQHGVTISHAPQLQFTDPGYTSGSDYAADQGNRWDMDSLADVREVVHATDYYISAGNLHIENSGVDPQVSLAVPTPIDASRYRFLTVRMHSERPNNVSDGTVARLFWHTEPFQPDYVATTQNIIVYPGWQEYSLDLSRAALIPSSPQWEANDWAVLRWDPNENTTGELWHTIIDYVALTAPPIANANFRLKWQVQDPENDVVEAQFYYDDDESGFDGTPIGQAVTAVGRSSPSPARTPGAPHSLYLPLVGRNSCGGNCLVWNTTAIPAGEYYVYGCLDDGVNRLCRYSDVPIRVSH